MFERMYWLDWLTITQEFSHICKDDTAFVDYLFELPDNKAEHVAAVVQSFFYVDCPQGLGVVTGKRDNDLNMEIKSSYTSSSGFCI